MADRLRFNEAQLTEYFIRIGLPQGNWLFSVVNVPDDEQLWFLELLKKHQLVTVPFENLSLHYSWHRVINVSPRHLFTKIVQSCEGRGGYCMEVNSLFHTVLLSLGFRVYMAGARVYDPSRKVYGGFTHCLNIVTIGETRYMLDVGFGANGPSAAIPLQVGCEHDQVEPAKVRLVHESIPQNVNQDCNLWIYQHKINQDAEWVPMYCFVEFEFILEDIRGLNLSPWKSPSSFFTQRVLVTRFTTKREIEGAADLEPFVTAFGPGDQIDGALIIDDKKLKWRRQGKTVLERTLETDDERVAALRKYFGVLLTEEDRSAIQGTVGQIVRRRPPMSIAGLAQLT